MTESVQETLKARGAKYGEFSSHARIAQRLKDACYDSPSADKLTPLHCEAIDMICHKLARIVNGDPNHVDSWHDIAGYSQLVENELIKPAPVEPLRSVVTVGNDVINLRPEHVV